jgi:hypothetical protein
MKNYQEKLPSNLKFGLFFSVIFLSVSLFFFFFKKSLLFVIIFGVLFIVFLTIIIFKSSILLPLNITWFKFGIILGQIISPIIMGAIFFLVVTPIGLLMRLFNKDLLNLKFNRSKSYWTEKNGPKSQMKNQF